MRGLASVTLICLFILGVAAVVAVSALLLWIFKLLPE